jgi:cytochrome P450
LNERISASVFSESLKQTDGMLNELFGPNSQTGDTTVTTRAFDMMKKITIHVLSGAGMGVSASWHDDENEKRKPGSKMTYIEAIKVIVECMAGPMALPLNVLNHWPSFLPGASLFHKLGLALGELSKHTIDMLEERRLQKKAPDGQKIDILTQLVDASKEGTTALNKYGTLSQQEMSGNLFIFTIAGFDTTSTTLSYAIVLAARYPQWQEWLIQEVDSLIPAGAESADWEYNDIFPQAKRTLAFMYETVRLQPPVVHVSL